MSVLVVKSVCTIFIFFCLQRVESYELRGHVSPKDAIATMSNASLSHLVSGRRTQQLNVTASSSVGSDFTFPLFGVGTNVSFATLKTYQDKLSEVLKRRLLVFPVFSSRNSSFSSTDALKPPFGAIKTYKSSISSIEKHESTCSSNNNRFY